MEARKFIPGHQRIAVHFSSTEFPPGNFRGGRREGLVDRFIRSFQHILDHVVELVEHSDADQIQILGQLRGEHVELVLDRDDNGAVHDEGNDLVFEFVQGRIGDLSRERREECCRLDGDCIELRDNGIGHDLAQVAGYVRPVSADSSFGRLGVEKSLPTRLLVERVGYRGNRRIEELVTGELLGRVAAERGFEEIVDEIQSALEIRDFLDGLGLRNSCII